MKLTGSDLINLFRDCSEKSHKLFIPDNPRQSEIADSLVKHYDGELLEKAVKWYFENRQGPFLIFDFAIESRQIVEKVKYENEAKLRFQDIVEETRKRLENS
jgi:hypothetical protein